MTEITAFPEDLQKGARNLLIGCVGVKPGDEVLLVRPPAGRAGAQPLDRRAPRRT